MPTVTNAVGAADLLRVHDARNQLFGSELFAADAWDIMLYLRAVETPRPARAICDALDMVEATGQRWISVLESEGLVAEEASAFFRLTDRALNDMETVLAAAAR